MKICEIADKALVKLREIKGVYASPLVSFTSSVKHMPKNNKYRVVLDLPVDQIGGGKDVRSITSPDFMDELKLIPVIVFIDPKELNLD